MRYRTLISITLGAVYFLILIGGIVRSTGSGMGCPDWPTCFGQWVPPTKAEELPSNYKENYSAYRDKKNQRFAAFLEAIGMKQTAYRLRNDESIRKEADFNAVKTWTEYINRLVGMVVGLLVTAVFIVSVSYFKSKKSVVITAGLALLTVIVTGWFGSIVVSTNLTPWTVTLHMALALVTVALLVLTKFLVENKEEVIQKPMFVWLSAGLLLTVIQIFLGTQVRESVDQVATNNPDRTLWVGQLGTVFLVHRSLSWLLLIVNAFIGWRVYQAGWVREGITLFIVLAVSLISGAAMSWFDIPAFLQPVHLLGGALLFGVQFSLWLNYRPVCVSTFQLKTT
ncbi:MAG: COX15/CtaA family protein [Cyclobacteriaceae bacterium]|nr:COX15/CtaA family protein [Cyclobacteriaceae bacterium]